MNIEERFEKYDEEYVKFDRIKGGAVSQDKCPHCGAGEQSDSSPRMPRRGAGNYPWSCGTLRDTVRPIRSSQCYENELQNERAVLAETRKENDILRALLPKLKAPCAHCGLEDISKCTRGFPGCAQADDLMCGDDAWLKGIKERFQRAEAEIREWKMACECLRLDEAKTTHAALMARADRCEDEMQKQAAWANAAELALERANKKWERLREWIGVDSFAKGSLIHSSEIGKKMNILDAEEKGQR